MDYIWRLIRPQPQAVFQEDYYYIILYEKEAYKSKNKSENLFLYCTICAKAAMTVCDGGNDFAALTCRRKKQDIPKVNIRRGDHSNRYGRKNGSK